MLLMITKVELLPFLSIMTLYCTNVAFGTIHMGWTELHPPCVVFEWWYTHYRSGGTCTIGVVAHALEETLKPIALF